MLTVSDNAEKSCLVLFGKAARLHHSFNDPAAVEGTDEESGSAPFARCGMSGVLT